MRRSRRRLCAVAPESGLRRYEYCVDHVGQVHLESTKYKTVATAYRDPKFLDTLYRGLRKGQKEWISICAGEVNVVSLDQDIDFEGIVVFHSLVDDELRYAGTLAEAFRPESLRFSEGTGLFFHPLSTKKKRLGDFGLVGSHVAHQLAPSLHFLPPPDEAEETTVVELSHNGRRHRLLAI